MFFYLQGIGIYCYFCALISIGSPSSSNTILRGTNLNSSKVESCVYPKCGCSAILHHDLLSPWHLYERQQFPWLVRIMQDGKFKAAGSLISDKWVVSSPVMLTGTKGIEAVIDRNLAQKITRLVVKLLIHPSATYKACRFCIMKLNESIDFKLYNGIVGTLCLPPDKSHFYNQVQMSYFFAPAGYDSMSTSYYRLRHFTLNCCHHEMEKCEIDGITCSSDFCPEWDSLGCKGSLGAPVMTRISGQFFLISVMCDPLGCEKQSPCLVLPMVSHHYDFIMKAMKYN